MNKQQVQQELDLLKKREAELLEILNKSEKKPEQFFLEVMSSVNRIVFDKEKYPDSTLFFSDGKLILEILNSNVWVRYYDVWFVFESEFLMKYSEIQSFIKIMLEKHFKIKDITPEALNVNVNDNLEKHFKTT